MKQLTEADMIEYVGLRDDGYFRFRLIQALEKLAIAHGCDCLDGTCQCETKPYMNDEGV